MKVKSTMTFQFPWSEKKTLFLKVVTSSSGVSLDLSARALERHGLKMPPFSTAPSGFARYLTYYTRVF